MRVLNPSAIVSAKLSAERPATLRAEELQLHADFRHLSSLQGVLHDLRYASVHNFMGKSLYGAEDCAWLRHEAASGLESAACWLQQRRPGWRLLVLDALRPQRVQQLMWQAVLGTDKQDYVADPARGSIHSYGMAADVTLLTADHQEVDMGSAFDQMDDSSHPELHAQLLASGLLSPVHVAHRDLLRDAMLQGGFAGIGTEWWHFDHGNRQQVRASLPRVE